MYFSDSRPKIRIKVTIGRAIVMQCVKVKNELPIDPVGLLAAAPFRPLDTTPDDLTAGTPL